MGIVSSFAMVCMICLLSKTLIFLMCVCGVGGLDDKNIDVPRVICCLVFCCCCCFGGKSVARNIFLKKLWKIKICGFVGASQRVLSFVVYRCYSFVVGPEFCF